MDNLEKFREAHRHSFATALAEIKSGRKKSHWMWYIFPQIIGLGHSETAKFYSIQNLEEAQQFLNDPLLVKNLIEICASLMNLNSNNASAIFGYPDDLKLKSSLTLFSMVHDAPKIFEQLLQKFFDGKPDGKTIRIVADVENSSF